MSLVEFGWRVAILLGVVARRLAASAYALGFGFVLLSPTAPVDQSLAACIGNSLSGDAGVQQVSPLLRVSMSLGSDTLSIRRPAPAALKTLSSGWAPSGLRH